MTNQKISNGVKETILSGIRASGKLHVGNYLGALKQFVELQEKHAGNCYFFIADLHALTTPFEPKKLSQDTIEVAADYLAAGINPGKSVFFLQSHVLEHTELGWIFNCLTSLGELERMTQFKDKTGLDTPFDLPDAKLAKKLLDDQNDIIERLRNTPFVTVMHATFTAEQVFNSIIKRGNIKAGLLTYPALMAADILLYKPTFVPVGDDQTQHLELTRDIARKFNKKFGKVFPEPKNFLMKPLRIMSLTDPTKKMSKTGDEALMLDDSPDEILRKLKKAVTATDAKQKSPGVENLFLLLEHFGTKEELERFNKQQKNNTIKYNELKEALAKNIADHFADFREKKSKLLKNPNQIIHTLTEGAAKASKVANQTLAEVKQKVGLI